MPSGSLITPAGDQGPPGVAGPSGPNAVSVQTGNRATIGSDGLIYVPPYPYADATQGGLTRQLNGLTTSFQDGTNSCQDLATAVRPVIWYVRQRSFNAVGNPNFEVDQRNIGTQVANPAGGTMIIDRWQFGKTATVTGQMNARQNAPGSGFGLAIPGSNYLISANFFSTSLQVGQATLASGDAVYILQQVEGTRFRELAGDGHSLSLMINCTTPLNLCAFIKDSASGYSLVLPCSIAAANTYYVLTFPALPAWPAGGVFSNQPGVLSYQIGICLACGSLYQTATTGVWQAGNFMGTAAQDNFMAKALNTVLRWAYIQHEPGQYCSSLQELDFAQNLRDCHRYYQKSYPYGVKAGTANNTAGAFAIQMFGSVTPQNPITFRRTMAKVPTVTGYSTVTGASAMVRDTTAAADKAITAAINVGDIGFSGFTVTSPNSSQWNAQGHWVADTLW